MQFSCDTCKHEGTDICDECSVSYGGECQCHLYSPCPHCEGKLWEEKDND